LSVVVVVELSCRREVPVRYKKENGRKLIVSNLTLIDRADR
jgi:hypothetical protein